MPDHLAEATVEAGGAFGPRRRWIEPPPPAAGGLLSRVLAARGWRDPASAAEFLGPSLRQLHDPGRMPDLDRAADRLVAAARAREPIVIYGDYDVDGVAATAILDRLIRAVAPGAIIHRYVPHRVDEGYGLNTGAVEQLAAQGARVIVTVDCGVTAVEPALAAASAGVDLIITDHHTPPADPAGLPRAYAIVHPRRPGSAYPYGDLCGAGVAFKLAWRVATLACGSERVPEPVRLLLLDLLALAALGVIADVVPLTGENRVIARFGLARLKSSPLAGVRALIDASGLAGDHIDAERVGFVLGPRLNACGRMGHARDAVELLTTDSPQRAADIAAMLCRLNDRRRDQERSVVEDATEQVTRQGRDDAARRSIVLAGAEWHPGVLGIACSRLVDRFYRPTLLLRTEGGVCSGSGRSVEGFGLHAALGSCRDWLLSFGGHDMAAGLRLEQSRLEGFARAFEQVCQDRIGPDQLRPSLAIDADADLCELTPRAVGELDALGPFGRGNPPVTVRVSRAVVRRGPEPFGRAAGHAAIWIAQPGRERLPEAGERAPRSILRVVGWGWAGRLTGLSAGSVIDAVVTPRLSSWNPGGRGPLVEPVLADLRPAQE